MHSFSTISARYTLGFVLGVVALNAFGGGLYGMSGAKAVPVAWLQGTRFKSYFIPSLILFVVVGISALVASISVFARWRSDSGLSLIAGLALLAWIIVQISIIGYVSGLQPVMIIISIIIVLLRKKIHRYD